MKKRKHIHSQDMEYALTHLQDGFFIFDKDWTCLYISNHALQLSKSQRDELIGENAWNIFPTLKNTIVYKKGLQAMKTGKKQTVEYKGKIFPGWLAFHIYPIKEGVAVFYYDITKQQVTEERLKESRDKYKSIVETSSDLIVMLDISGKIVYVSPSVKKTLGYSPKELVGRQSLLNVLPEEKIKLQNAMQKALQGKSSFIHYSAKHKSGRWVRMEANSRVLIDTNKKPYLIITTSRDITKRAEYENKLKESEEKFRSLVRYSEDVYELLDAKGNILYISDSFKRILGLNPKQFIGKNVFDYIHAEDKERIYAAFLRIVAKSGHSETVTYRGLHPQKKIVWVEATGINHLHDPAINAVIVNFRDITKRKATEDQLYASEERFRTLADNIPNLAWIAHADGNIFWFNSRWYQYTGTTLQQVEGWGWKSVHDPKELPHVLERWKNSLKTGNTFEMVFPLRGADGIFRPFLTRIVPIKDNHGRILRWFGTNTDITNQKQIEQRKDDFIALASHELKTPLTSTKILTQVLKKRFAKIPDALELLTKMDNQIDKLSALVTEMLDISKIQQGKLELKNEKFYLKTIAQEVVDDLQPITKHKLLIDWHTKEYFYVDKERVRQVLVNFITNAIKYSPPNKDIIIRSKKVDGSIAVSVQDFGVGIPKEEQLHIFGRFYQARTKEWSTYPGLGLGLYISRELITRMGGKVWVESEIGKGSTFYFSLPIAKH